MSEEKPKSDLAFEQAFPEDSPPELWRVSAMRNAGNSKLIKHVNWFASETAAIAYRDWINDGRGHVISLKKYMRFDHVQLATQDLIWCDAAEAETWPEGIAVLERREIDGEVWYETDNYLRPGWLADKSRRPGKWSWAKLRVGGEGR